MSIKYLEAFYCTNNNMKSKGLRPQQRNELKKLPEWMKQ